MATHQVTGIVPGDESNSHDEPHVEAARIPVRYIQRRVEGRSLLAPETVADQPGLDVGDVYAALTYYHRNPDEMRRVERRRVALAVEAEARTSLTPPDE